MSQTKTQLVEGLSINTSAPADALAIGNNGEFGIAGNNYGTSGQVLTSQGSGSAPQWSTIASDSISEGNTSVEVVDTGSNGEMRCITEGSRRLTVYSDGNISVGPRTTTPGELLALETTTGSSLSLGHSGQGRWIVATDNANLKVSNLDGEKARIDSSGRLLVGTSTARSNFFNTSVSALQQIEDLTNPRIAVISSSDVGGRGGQIVLAHQRSATIGGNTVLNSGDNIGIVSFQGNDGTEFVEGARIEAFVDNTPGANDMPGRLSFHTTADGASSPTSRMTIFQNGNVVIAKTSNGIGPNGYHFDNTGEFTATMSSGNTFVVYSSGYKFYVNTNGGIYNVQGNNVNLSDEREKKNIVNLDSTWDCLKHWELKKFHYNEDADDADLRYGVIAQQVAPHCPEVISDWVTQKAADAVLDEDGNEIEPAKEEIVRMGVKEQQMMWMAIKALQEAQTRIETLEAANASQAATIATLDARLTALEGAG